ncbi:hypothetical protein L484_019602 [Morus notabilis]|uniref:Uncharacterized protein n=1 Tax=Morus notabilis TaxID=981085 RepID=W9SKE0_9ROSA|nr:hypothetical protein L484_019602 [Morus notabilis]
MAKPNLFPTFLNLATWDAKSPLEAEYQELRVVLTPSKALRIMASSGFLCPRNQRRRRAQIMLSSGCSQTSGRDSHQLGHIQSPEVYLLVQRKSQLDATVEIPGETLRAYTTDSIQATILALSDRFPKRMLPLST